ncbi:hypothetical protein THSYN_26445 [Candidatus Thiodictyon syntrophicum]|uniref:TIR domain-containing protein n=2 Tax=Candidatus Thiodictyon syntrophicum TaxID=1166950 RepID=A0A2K8UF40_9GAMM|nr:hypothetical protein THSYN_26445 [Candidatus Thiodictyon syntrophicum]
MASRNSQGDSATIAPHDSATVPAVSCAPVTEPKPGAVRMAFSTPAGLGFTGPADQYHRWNLHDPALRGRLRAALCGEDPAFQRVIELRGPTGSGKTYLLRAAAFDAGRCGWPLVHAVLDLDAASPDGVLAEDYLDKVLLELRQRQGKAGARRAAAIHAQFNEVKVKLRVNLSGWDRLAWLPLAIELEFPAARLPGLFLRHWTPDQARPPPERFLETLRDLAESVADRRGGGGVLLQIPEQRQPEASVRDLLLQWLPSLPGLVLAFTQHDAGRECDYQDLAPLRLALQPLTAADLDHRLAGCLGAQALPRPLLQAVAIRAQGSPGLAALTLVDLAQRDLIGPDPAGVWRLRDQAESLADLDQLFGPGIFRPLHGLIERMRSDAGPEAAADLRSFLDHGCLCGRNIAFGIVADCLGLDEARRDRLLDLLDAHLVEPQADPTAANLSVHPLPPTPSHAGEPESFNVFLSHNSRDKPAVRQLAQALQARGLKVWLDEEELVPGRPWQEAVERIIQSVHTAAVLVGRDGLGPWEVPEMRACLSQCVTRRLPVIPVLLPDAPVEPALPLFLQAFTWVDLRAGLTDDGLNRLEWGITGLKPNGLPSPRLSPAMRGSEQSAVDANAPEPQLDYLGCRHPNFPDQEVFRFRNPLLAQHLRNRQSRRDRQQRAQALLARLAAVLPPHNRGIAELHLAVLDHVGDQPRRRALDGELFYWLNIAHARSASRLLVGDLKARRVSPEAVWDAIKQNEDRWPVWRRLAWLDAYGRQPHGVPEGMRRFWLNRLAGHWFSLVLPYPYVFVVFL